MVPRGVQVLSPRQSLARHPTSSLATPRLLPHTTAYAAHEGLDLTTASLIELVVIGEHKSWHCGHQHLLCANGYQAWGKDSHLDISYSTRNSAVVSSY